MSNEFIIKSFFRNYSGVFAYGADYILVDDGEYLVICPFSYDLMACLNYYISRELVGGEDFIIRHCTCKDNLMIRGYYEGTFTGCIKCYAFDKRASIYESVRKTISFEELTYWLSPEMPDKFLFLHTADNKVVTNKNGKLVSSTWYYHIESVINNAIIGTPLLSIDNKKIINEFNKYKKPLKR